MPTIHISSELFARIQSFAVPLVDTCETVIGRAIDALAEQSGDGSNVGSKISNIKVFDGAAAPNLSYADVRSVVIAGVKLPTSQAYWNNLLRALLRLAAAKYPPEVLSKNLFANHIVGERSGTGYVYVEEADISVQGGEANKIWRSAYAIAELAKIPVEVEFQWRDEPKAANPGQVGKFMLAWAGASPAHDYANAVLNHFGLPKPMVTRCQRHARFEHDRLET